MIILIGTKSIFYFNVTIAVFFYKNVVLYYRKC